MPRPKQRTPELRDRLLAAAVELLERDGAAALTTRGVARAAGTSPPAVYELFGDKAGLVRAVFFDGYRELRARMDALPETGDARADLLAVGAVYRAFARERPALAEVMFSRPFTDFAPGPDELRRTGSVRAFIVERVRRAIDAGVLAGDETDVALALVALVQGLAQAEGSRRLGSSPESVDRRWSLAVEALVDGLAPRG